jgi:hypothetical protein
VSADSGAVAWHEASGDRINAAMVLLTLLLA